MQKSNRPRSGDQNIAVVADSFAEDILTSISSCSQALLIDCLGYFKQEYVYKLQVTPELQNAKLFLVVTPTSQINNIFTSGEKKYNIYTNI